LIETGALFRAEEDKGQKFSPAVFEGTFGYPNFGDTTMVQGRVKWFDNRKGYGFIERENEEDVFVHYRNIPGDGFKTLKDGELVEFEIEKGDKGLHALDVHCVTETSA